MAGITIKSKNGKVDVKHLLAQMAKQEKRINKMLGSGKYEGDLKAILLQQLADLQKMRDQLQQPKEDQGTDGQ